MQSYKNTIFVITSTAFAELKHNESSSVWRLRPPMSVQRQIQIFKESKKLSRQPNNIIVIILSHCVAKKLILSPILNTGRCQLRIMLKCKYKRDTRGENYNLNIHLRSWIILSCKKLFLCILTVSI